MAFTAKPYGKYHANMRRSTGGHIDRGIASTPCRLIADTCGMQVVYMAA